MVGIKKLPATQALAPVRRSLKKTNIKPEEDASKTSDQKKTKDEEQARSHRLKKSRFGSALTGVDCSSDDFHAASPLNATWLLHWRQRVRITTRRDSFATCAFGSIPSSFGASFLVRSWRADHFDGPGPGMDRCSGLEAGHDPASLLARPVPGRSAQHRLSDLRRLPLALLPACFRWISHGRAPNDRNWPHSGDGQRLGHCARSEAASFGIAPWPS
jgi:hypothetical protein